MTDTTEADVAAAVVSLLEERGAEVFQEVVFKGRRIDIVAVRDKVVAAIECKLTLNLDVIAQALHWRPFAHEVWVAAVESPHSRTYPLGVDFCSRLGVGVVAGVVERYRLAGARVEVEAMRQDVTGVSELLAALHPDQKTAAPAGTNAGGYSTKYKRFCVALTEYVRQHPGVTLGVAEQQLDHVWSRRSGFLQTLSARLNVQGAHREAALAGIRIDGKGARATLWPMEGEF